MGQGVDQPIKFSSGLLNHCVTTVSVVSTFKPEFYADAVNLGVYSIRMDLQDLLRDVSGGITLLAMS